MDSLLSMSSFNGKEEANKIKYLHLSRENSFLIQTVQELREQILSLRNINQQLQQGLTSNKKALINELTQQNSNLQQSMFRLMKKNEQLSCDTLMKSQLLCENQNQTNQILTNYEQKIYQLRMQLQSKQNLIKKIQDKYIRDKEDQYGQISEANILYFDELNQLRIIVDNINAENAQLKSINLQKQQEISKIKNQLIQCQNMLKNPLQWQLYKCSSGSNINTDRTEDKKTDYTSNANQQLKRQDTRFKVFDPQNNDFLPLQANNNKIISSLLRHQNQKLKNQNTKLLKEISIKNKQVKTIQFAYQKINSEIKKYQLDLYFYQNIFHQYTKVAKQRQIQKYQYPINQKLFPIKELSEKQNLIRYWKTWAQLHKNDQSLAGKRVLSTFSLKNNRQRSLSCISKFKSLKQQTKNLKRPTEDIEQQILSFNNDLFHGQNKNNQYSEYQSIKTVTDQNVFTEQISSIIKPKNGAINFLKRQFLEIDMEVQ